MKTLTPKQAELFQFLEERSAAGKPPSYREIANHFGYSRNNAYLSVCALKDKGLVYTNRTQKGGVVVADEHEPFAVKECSFGPRFGASWISIWDSLPGVGKTVLVVVKMTPQLPREIALGCMQARGFIVNGEVNHDVTHWMPLPKMPAEEPEPQE